VKGNSTKNQTSSQIQTSQNLPTKDDTSDVSSSNTLEGSSNNANYHLIGYQKELESHLYISEDDGLGRYKFQTKDGKILKQYFVPAGYVEGCYNRFIELSNDFKKLQDTPDAYSRQTNWCNLQDNAIYFINHILDQLTNDLKQEIEKCLGHYVMSLGSTIKNPINFVDFYNKVVEREKRIRLQNRENTHSSSLIIFNSRNRTTFIIHINNLKMTFSI
jgi:hypothetical protein